MTLPLTPIALGVLPDICETDEIAVVTVMIAVGTVTETETAALRSGALRGIRGTLPDICETKEGTTVPLPTVAVGALFEICDTTFPWISDTRAATVAAGALFGICDNAFPWICETWLTTVPAVTVAVGTLPETCETPAT